MELKDLVSLFFERSNAYEVFWGFYITVVLGVLGYLGVEKSHPGKAVCITVSIVFCAFAYVNIVGLWRANEARIAAKDLVLSGSFSDVSTVSHDALTRLQAILVTTPRGPLIAYHLVCDLFVLAAIWYLPFVKNRSGSSTARVADRKA